MFNKEIAPISASKFLSLIPAEDFSPLAKEGLMLYSTNKSTCFNPLVLWKQEGNIMVVMEDYIQENILSDLFTDEDVIPDSTYSFSEDELLALIGDEPEFLPDIIAFLEENQEVDANDFMGLLTLLKNEGFSVVNLLSTIPSLSRNEIQQLLFHFKEAKTFLRQYFTKLFCDQNSTDEEE